MKIIYLHHTAIGTELVVECCPKQPRCKEQCGTFPDDELRVTAMALGQPGKFLTASTALCENTIVLVDGRCPEALETEISMASINKKINPGLCTKIIGL